jgi:hypothetical protein
MTEYDIPTGPLSTAVFITISMMEERSGLQNGHQTR